MKKNSFTSVKDLPIMLSVSQVAAVLNISRASAYELAHCKNFPAMLVGCRKTSREFWVVGHLFDWLCFSVPGPGPVSKLGWVPALRTISSRKVFYLFRSFQVLTFLDAFLSAFSRWLLAAVFSFPSRRSLVSTHSPPSLFSGTI